MNSAQSIRRTPLDVVPAALVLGAGALTIALSSNGGRHGAHQFWLAAVLVESVVAVLYRRRHRLVSLAAVLGIYLLFDTPLSLVLLPLFLVLVAIAASRTERATFPAGVAATAVVFLAPALHGDALDAFHVLLPLGVIGLAVMVGSLWKNNA
jgi:hypothetical protein